MLLQAISIGLIMAAVSCSSPEKNPASASDTPKTSPRSSGASDKLPTKDEGVDVTDPASKGSGKEKTPKKPAPSSGQELTWLEKTGEVFKNGDPVFTLHYRNTTVHADNPDIKLGEFWPIRAGLKLMTKQSAPQVFDDLASGSLTYSQILDRLSASGIAPDGMSKGTGTYQIEGDTIIDGIHYPCISDATGVPCNPYPNYGIVELSNSNHEITLTHRNVITAGARNDAEIKSKMDEYFQEKVDASTASPNDRGKYTVFFLPVIKREAATITGTLPKVHRALLRLVDNKGVQQFGLVVFETMHSYDDTLKYLTTLSVPSLAGLVQVDVSHIYFTDGGATWGQVTRLTKPVNASDTDLQPKDFGTADYNVITNLLVLY